MNYAIILAGGVGQRMRNSGMPKQFLEVFGKPILVYTIEKFEQCDDVDQIIIACNASWIDYMMELLIRFNLKKVRKVVVGGKNRQGSIDNALKVIENTSENDNDIVVIHDGVRPLVNINVISENIRVARQYGCAMTVRAVVESVVITNQDVASFEDFKKRDDTYTLTSPQTFKLGILRGLYKKIDGIEQPFPLLDTALIYTFLGNQIHIVKEDNQNIKITTPEDYYILKAMLELQESKNVFGI